MMRRTKAFRRLKLTILDHKRTTPFHLSFHCSSSSSSIHQLHQTLKPVTNLIAFASTSNSPILGSQIHAHTIKIGLSNDTFTQNNLLVMYSKLGLLSYAVKVFEEMSERNLVTWTAMISGFVHSAEWEMGVRFYFEMLRSGFCPNEFTLASVFTACVAIDDVRIGCSIHSAALKLGLDGNCFVGSSLMNMYAEFGNLWLVELVFEGVAHRDVACWNAMIEAYASNGYSADALRIVSLMHYNGLVMDQYTYISALKACLSSGDLRYMQQIHGVIVCSGFKFSTSVMNALVDTYFRNGMRDSALKVFCRTREKDIISWNTVISGFAQEERPGEVVALISEMMSSGLKPNQVTLSMIFRLCGAVGDLALGIQFCSLAYHLGFFSDVLVVNSLINMFSKCDMLESSYFFFKSLHAKSTVTCNEMIVGFLSNGYAKEALQFFHCLVQQGFQADEHTYSTIFTACQGPEDLNAVEQIHACSIKSGLGPNCIVSSAMVNAYSRLGSVESSRKIFQEIEFLDLVSWGTMISALSKNGNISEVLLLINCMRRGGDGHLDEFILASVLNACANTAAFSQCKCIHAHAVKTRYERHLWVASALLDAYAKCGDISSSRLAFGILSGTEDAVIFSAMITAYAHHGLITEAVDIFETLKQENLHLSHATFTAVISACNHLGFVEEGQRIFDSISSDYKMRPSKDNYACLVDLFARNGLLEKSRNVIDCMPFKPWPAIWRSLLNGSRIHGDKEMAELAAKQIFQLMPDDGSAHVLLSNVYAGDGRWEDAEKVRMRLEEKGLHKVPGYSKIEI